MPDLQKLKATSLVLLLCVAGYAGSGFAGTAAAPSIVRAIERDNGHTVKLWRSQRLLVVVQHLLEASA